jgi:hypothetical protein
MESRWKDTFARGSKGFFPFPDIHKSALTPFNKGWNYRELLLKFPFEKGGFRGI